MIRRPPRSTPLYSSAASDVYKRQFQTTAQETAKSLVPRTVRVRRTTSFRVLADLRCHLRCGITITIMLHIGAAVPPGLRLISRKFDPMVAPLSRKTGQLSLASLWGRKLSTSFSWGKSRNVISAGWHITLCDTIWHASSRSSEAFANCHRPLYFSWSLPRRLHPSDQECHQNDDDVDDLRAADRFHCQTYTSATVSVLVTSVQCVVKLSHQEAAPDRQHRTGAESDVHDCLISKCITTTTTTTIVSRPFVRDYPGASVPEG